MNRILCFFGLHRLASVTYEGRIGIWCVCCNYQDAYIPSMNYTGSMPRETLIESNRFNGIPPSAPRMDRLEEAYNPPIDLESASGTG